VQAASPDRDKELKARKYKMKHQLRRKALCGLQLLLGLLLFASGSGQPGGLGLVVQQIEIVGARQWFSLMAGSIASSGAPIIAPVSQRISSAFLPRRSVSPDGDIA
jgi:hypothetical protein